MYSPEDPLGIPHSVTYWVPFWDEPVIAECTCGLSHDHFESIPLLGADTAAGFWRSVRAWFRKEPRQ